MMALSLAWGTVLETSLAEDQNPPVVPAPVTNAAALTDSMLSDPSYALDLARNEHPAQSEDFENAVSGCCETACGCGESACGNGGGHGCGDGAFRSDRGFCRFIEPITNPVFFEDPRSMTRLRVWFMNQMIPEHSILAGGDLQVFAAQATVALNERFALIAQKDGYIQIQPDSGLDVEGWGDIATGVKYVIIRDPCNQFILSGGVLYEWSNGSRDVWQGNGDGMWNFFLSAGKELGRTHVIGNAGYHQPNNSSQESTWVHYSLHVDYMLTNKFYLL
jgi:hypothetical protein